MNNDKTRKVKMEGELDAEHADDIAMELETLLLETELATLQAARVRIAAGALRRHAYAKRTSPDEFLMIPVKAVELEEIDREMDEITKLADTISDSPSASATTSATIRRMNEIMIRVLHLFFRAREARQGSSS